MRRSSKAPVITKASSSAQPTHRPPAHSAHAELPGWKLGQEAQGWHPDELVPRVHRLWQRVTCYNQRRAIRQGRQERDQMNPIPQVRQCQFGAASCCQTFSHAGFAEGGVGSLGAAGAARIGAMVVRAGTSRSWPRWRWENPGLIDDQRQDPLRRRPGIDGDVKSAGEVPGEKRAEWASGHRQLRGYQTAALTSGAIRVSSQ